MNAKLTLPQSGSKFLESTPSDILRRYEKINTSIFENEHQGVEYLAGKIVDLINNHDYAYNSLDGEPEDPFVLGLSTGRTPVGLYRELVRRYQAGEVSFENVVVYSLDEFYPITPSQQQSRNYRTHEDFLSHVNIKPSNIHIFDGTVNIDKVSAYCQKFESAMKNIHLMIMGMGEQGQIGFNEPGSSYNSRTRLVLLNHKTRQAQLPFFHSYEDIPKMAITMGIGTIMKADRIFLLAWGDGKAPAVKKVVEEGISENVPASYLQTHPNIEVVIDGNGAEELTREQTPWLVGPCKWTPKLIRKAVIWLCGVVDKSILKLTYTDYIDNSLGQLVESVGPYDKINIDIFNDLQHTISGWPGGKPNADDSMRPTPSKPYPKRVLIFSPYPDDDVISMGGTFLRLVEQGHDVHVAYQTSGSISVDDDVVLQMMDMARENSLGDKFGYAKSLIDSKKKGEPDSPELLGIKAALRRSEAKAVCRLFGLDEVTNAHFLNMPFYETGGIKKGRLAEEDIALVVEMLRKMRPHQIYAAGDFADPHGTRGLCIEAISKALKIVRDEPWIKECQIWLYRGGIQEWNLGLVDMAVPLSPEEVINKRHAIYRHLSQKGIAFLPWNDNGDLWLKVEEKNRNTASLYDKLGMAEYQAIEVFVRVM